jgi:ABC-type polysaccharide/polyol phosphate export permease
MYPSNIIPDAYRTWLLYLNPAYYLILMFRVPIYDGVLPALSLSLIGAGLSLITLMVGWIYFSNQADKFAYRA